MLLDNQPIVIELARKRVGREILERRHTVEKDVLRLEIFTGSLGSPQPNLVGTSFVVVFLRSVC